MKTLLLLGLLPLLAVSGGGPSPKGSENQRFVDLANRCLSGLRQLDPESATVLGDHRFDDRLTDRSRAGIERQLAFSRAYLDSVRGIDLAKLDPANQIDCRILRSNLESGIWQTETIRDYDWNPLAYNPGSAIYALVARDFAPLRERLANLKGRLLAVPEVVAAAKANLRKPPRIHTETAITQNEGNIGLIRDDLDQFLEDAPDLKAELAPARAQAVAALQEYGRWLKEDLLPKANGDFRIGADRFRQKLRYTLESDLSPEDILASARRDLAATEKAMVETAKPLYEKLFPGQMEARKTSDREIVKAVLDKLAESHPDNDTVVAKAKEDLAACTRHVREKNLVTVPGDPIKVIVMPEFQRGVAIAYCDGTGPLEKKPETFYSIAPTPKDWPPARVASFFREYNDYMLMNLTIHEAMPGHYLQGMHANAFKAPTLTRAILANGTFVEGWAVYAEQIMAESGFGGPEVKMQQLKMKLRVIINAIIDQGIHAGGMTEQQAMDMMMKDGYQEEGEAAGKWRRAVMSSTQLSTYYVGCLELNRIRDDWRKKVGANFDLKTFDDTLLSFGSPAPKYVRELMGL